MRGLYDWLLGLYPADVREEFGAEMKSVFLQANEEARAQGWWRYGEFCVQEMFGMFMGLLGDGGVGRYKTWIRLCGVVGLGWAGYMAWQQTQQLYLSVAVLKLTPARVAVKTTPEELTANDVNRVMQEVLARPAVANMITTLNLYPGERQRQPMEEVVETFRKSVRVAMVNMVGGDGPGKGVQIRFSYGDALLAQEVVRELATRTMATMEHELRERALRTERTLEEMAAAAGREMDTARPGATSERGRVDLALAQRQYEAAREKLTEAKRARLLADRKEGPQLTVLDPASLPVENAMYEYAPWSVAGAAVGGWLAGVCFGFVTAWIWWWRPGHRPAATH